MVHIDFRSNPGTSAGMASSTNSDIVSAADAGTLTGLLLERARRSPERVAYSRYDPTSERWTDLNWRQTVEAAGRWQAALRCEGLHPGDRVGIRLSNRPEWVYFDMAASGLGLVTVPLYINDRAENIRHILDDAGVRLLLLEDRKQLEELAHIAPNPEQLQHILVLEPGNGERTATIDFTAVADWLGDMQGELEDLVEDPDDLATIVYTSGTTGPPKGAMLSHRNLLWDAEASLSLVPAFPTDIFLSFLPLSHTLERTGGYYLPMMAGSTVAYARSIPQLADDLRIVRPTVLISVPLIFERIYVKIQAKLKHGPALTRKLFEMGIEVGWHSFEHTQGRRPWSADLLLAPVLDRLVGSRIRARLGSRLRVAVSGGAPIPPGIARFFIGLGIPLGQGYGLTETSPVVSVSPVEDNIPASVGVPLPGVQVRIGDKDELLVKSPGLMLGYWNQPEATAEAIDADGWLHTGDQGRVEGEHIFITGRLKDVIVLSNGEKAAPAYIEMTVTMDSLFSQVLLLGEGRPYLAALVVLDRGAYAELAADEGLDPETPGERPNPRLEDILVERVGKLLQSSTGYAKIPRIAVVPGPWSIENGLLTPTMKPKRSLILAKYPETVKRLYEGTI